MGAEQSVPTGAEQPSAPQDAGAGDEEVAPAGPPKALVVVGPSGVGKGTLITGLLASNPEKYALSVSTTTRAPRPGEEDGVHYAFTSKEAMMSAIARGEFLEHAEVHGSLYGTRRDAAEAALAAGRVCVLDIDVQGARQVRKAGLPALFVFVAPPSLEELERRLRAGPGGGEAELQRRLGAAKGEITSLNERGLYDYLLINDDLAATAAQLARIAERCAKGLPAEPGMVPEKVILEDEGEPGADEGDDEVEEGATAKAASVATTDGGTTHTSTYGGSAASAAAAGAAAAAAAAAASTSGAQQQGQQQQQQQQQQREAGASGSGGAAAAASRVSPAAADMMEGLGRWRGKVALVTGASSGIGWAVCEALGRAGMRVVAVARRRERLEELQRRMLGPEVGAEAVDFLPVVCDVTKEAEVQALPRIVLKRWPDRGIDVLFNNAGLARNDASLFDGNTASWVEMVSTNLLGGAMMAREVVRDMRRRGEWGHIINMVGLSGHRIPDAAAGGSFFAATKFAVRAITDGLRQEARANGVPLRVSGISPGLVDTEFFEVRAFGDAAAAAAAKRQISKCLEPADVARAVLGCLSAPAHVEVNDVVIRPTEQLI